jgi:hypothetical protein
VTEAESKAEEQPEAAKTDGAGSIPPPSPARRGLMGKLIGPMLFPLVCVAYFSSEAVLRRQCYHLVKAEADDKLRQELLNQLPSFVRRPIEENLKRSDAEAAVAAAKDPSEKCAKLRELIGFVALDKAVALHQEIVSLCPEEVESGQSWLVVLRELEDPRQRVEQYLAYVGKLREKKVKLGQLHDLWSQGTTLVGSDDELFLDYVAEAAMARWVSPGLGEHYRRMQRLAVKRGHTDAAVLAKDLAAKCDEAALRELERAQKQQQKGF